MTHAGHLTGRHRLQAVAGGVCGIDVELLVFDGMSIDEPGRRQGVASGCDPDETAAPRHVVALLALARHLGSER